jgi:hypothetical protein
VALSKRDPTFAYISGFTCSEPILMLTYVGLLSIRFPSHPKSDAISANQTSIQQPSIIILKGISCYTCINQQQKNSYKFHFVQLAVRIPRIFIHFPFLGCARRRCPRKSTPAAIRRRRLLNSTLTAIRAKPAIKSKLTRWDLKELEPNALAKTASDTNNYRQRPKL